MSSDQTYRELSSEQLTSAEESLTEFNKVAVKYEEEVDGPSRLLDLTRIPLIILHRIDLVQHNVKEEEVNTDQQFCSQEKNFSLDQKDPEPLQIKEEHDELEHLQIKVEKELSLNKDEDQHVLKQETDTFVVTPSYEDLYHTEPEPNRNP
ncbi:hypothetical protein AMECASPLE_018896, partial [Ameca splendens]